MDDVENNLVSKPLLNQSSRHSNEHVHNLLKWTGDINDTIYSYYSGWYLSQGLAAFYIGQPLVTTTNEIVHFQHTWIQNVLEFFGGGNYTQGILAIPATRLWVYPEIQEIDRQATFSLSNLFQQLARSVLGFHLTHASDVPRYTPLYPLDEQGSVVNYTVVSSKSSLGQITDINDFQRRYMSLKRLNPKNIVVYGVSRGAATTFAALADHHYDNIKLCILEGPPGSISSLFKFYFSQLLGPLLYNPLIAYLFLGQQHNVNKESQAIARVDRFPLDIPLVIISSRNDEVVCHKSSLNIALRVAANRQMAKEQDKQIAAVYFLQLDTPLHNYYTRGNTKDSQRYQNFIHAIYRKYELPYIEQFANAGEHELRIAELTQGPLEKQVSLQAMFKQQKDDRERIRHAAFNMFKSNSINQLDFDARARAANICAEMPLYAKRISSDWSFFKRNHVQDQLKAIISEPLRTDLVSDLT